MMTGGLQQQRKPREAAVKYYIPYSRPTFIILWLAKGSGTEDKSFAEN